MRPIRALAILAGTGLYIVAGIGPAYDDAIDGHWCSDDGRHLSIKGPTIVTPGGTTMQGAYSRHFFRYTAPDGEPNGGKEVAMRLLNETTVRIQFAPADQPQIWHRCHPQIS